MNPEQSKSSTVLTTTLIVGAGCAGAGIFFHARAAGVLENLLTMVEETNKSTETKASTSSNNSKNQHASKTSSPQDTAAHASWWDEEERSIGDEEDKSAISSSSSPKKIKRRALIWVDRSPITLFGGGSLSSYEINSNTSSIRFIKNAWGYGAGGFHSNGNNSRNTSPSMNSTTNSNRQYHTDPFSSPRNTSPNPIGGINTLLQSRLSPTSSSENVSKMQARDLNTYLLDQKEYTGNPMHPIQKSNNSSNNGNNNNGTTKNGDFGFATSTTSTSFSSGLFRSDAPKYKTAKTNSSSSSQQQQQQHVLTKQTETLLSYNQFRCPLSHAGRYINDACKRLILTSDIWIKCEGRSKKNKKEKQKKIQTTCRAVGSKRLLSVTVRNDGAFHCIFEDTSYNNNNGSNKSHPQIAVRTKRLVLALGGKQIFPSWIESRLPRYVRVQNEKLKMKYIMHYNSCNYRKNTFSWFIFLLMSFTDS